MEGAWADASGASTDCQREQWQELIRSGVVLWTAVTRRVGEVTDLADPEWRVLDMIDRLGQVRISDLAEYTQIGMSTVSRTVSRAIEHGLVETCDGPHDDARHKWVRLTEAGKAEAKPIQEARDTAVRELMMDQMTPSEWDMLNDVFARILVNAEAELRDAQH